MLRSLHKSTIVLLLACIAFTGSLAATLIVRDLRVDLHNSDLLYLPALYRDLTEWGGSITEWKLPPAPYFFPDMLLFFALERLLGNYHLSLILAGVIQTLLYLAGWLLLAARLSRSAESRAYAQALLLLVAAAFFFLDSSGFFSLLHLRITIHFGIILLAPYILALLIAYFRRAGFPPLHLVALFLLSLLMTMSDSLYIFQVVIPLAISAVFLFWIAKIRFLQMLFSQAALIAGAAGGMWLNKAIIRYPNLNLYTSVDDLRLQKAITAFGEWLPEWLLDNPLVAMVILTALGWHLFAIIYSVRRAAMGRAFRAELSLVSGFVGLSVLLTLFAVIVTGNFIDRHSSRYLLPLFLFPLYALPLWVTEAHFGEGAPGTLVLSAMAILIILSCVSTLFSLGSLAGYADFYPPLVECLDRECEKRGLTNGIGHYWDAKYLTMLSKRGLQIIQVKGNLEPYHWISNICWYERFPSEFILYDPKASGELYRMSEDTIVRRFGEPAERFDCAGRIVLVYNRREDAQFRASLAQSALVLQSSPLSVDFGRPGVAATFAAAALPSGVGMVVGESRVADLGEVGYLTFGPYVKLPRGLYQAEILYEAEGRNPTIPYIGSWDVALTLPNRIEVIEQGGLVSGRASIVVEFDIASSSIVEIRTFSYGTGRLTVHKVELRRLR